MTSTADDDAAAERRLEEDWRRWRQFFSDLDAESDRAAVVIGAAQLDELLVRLLRANLLPVVGSDSLLDGPSAAFGTFSSRIEGCYRLGLIDADMGKALTLLRRIRNSFAHEPGSLSLTQGPEAGRVRELLSICRRLSRWSDLVAAHATRHVATAAELRVAISYMAMLLDEEVDISVPLTNEDAVRLLDEEFALALCEEFEDEALEKGGSPRSA